MQDIAPDLLKKILELFAEKTERDPTIAAILEHIDAGTATAEDVQRFAIALGVHESDALLDVLTPDVLPDGKMYYNIAEQTVRPTIEQSHELFSEAAAQIQKQLNENAGIGLRAVTPKLDEDRVRGIIDKISDAPLFEDVRWVLNEPIRVLVQSFADEFVKANAEFQADAGLSPTITRTVVGGCCQWCRALAGKYTYPREVPKDVYRRHAYCRCLVTYDPGDGSKRVQNVHSKKWATREELEERKVTGTSSVLQEIAQHPARLASFTPEELKRTLEAAGEEVNPLSRGSLKGISFDAGGGFKVNFADGGLLQFHPADKSHHGGAYYKISTGKGGTHRYEIDGTEKTT